MNNEDIFIIDSWPDNKEKENTLIDLILIFKQFDIPILLTGHYPIRPEIQKMVDYYLFDKNNPVLKHSDFNKYALSSGRWTKMGDIEIINEMPFHHDFAIWETMRNAFNYAKYLGKKYIHFLEYDNLPDPYQYKQAFIEQIRNHDAIIYEYEEHSSANPNINEYCATFIFSIKTDVAINLVNKANSIEEYYSNRPNGWQLEVLFLKYLREVTSDIFVSKYIACNNELNIHAVWNRDGINRNGARFQVYLAVDDSNDLYIHFISGFSSLKADKDYLVEINYDEIKTFHTVEKDDFSLLNIGRYKKGRRVVVYYQGLEVFNQFLGEGIQEFRKMNKIVKKKNTKRSIRTNFIDGPFIEILDDNFGKFNVEFINKTDNTSVYSVVLNNNNWARANKKYFIDWQLKVSGDFAHNYNAKDKNILISLDSKSVGDTLAWIPYVEEFRKKHECNVICSTFHNNLFISAYPNIKFVKPGSVVKDIYAHYRIGYYITKEGFDNDRIPNDPRKLPLQKIATDILGLEYKEIKPAFNDSADIVKTNKVTIGFHSTAQCKYWNNPTGWQEVVDYLLKLGYEPIIISKEEDGYMGNHFPTGVTHMGNLDLIESMKIIKESQFFIGLSSGLSWLSWAVNTPTILISGFTNKSLEPQDNIYRVLNPNVCNSCLSEFSFDAGDWNWCPRYKGTDKQFECSKQISSQMVIDEINKIREK
jgi:autotransporter strand-loop-strand O-heptosyltransferase